MATPQDPNVTQEQADQAAEDSALAHRVAAILAARGGVTTSVSPAGNAVSGVASTPPILAIDINQVADLVAAKVIAALAPSLVKNDDPQ
jgi:hypothetical protein